jgi:exopolyphosphatase/guanosine-5'-triphosphate,3'-diphosphate pyrophosphatase
VPRLAAVDIGSNTVHALVADATHEGRRGWRLADLGYFVEMPELGAEVQRTGRIGEAKSGQAIASMHTVIACAAELGYEELVAGATAAVRSAADGEEFLARVSREIGVPVRLIAPDKEAELSFLGVASRHAARHEWLMGDMGGASTELVVADGRRMSSWVSLRLGTGTFADRYLSDPPQPGEREALRRAALPQLESAPECNAQKLVMTGGTASNLPLVISPHRPPRLLSTKALLVAAERLDRGPAAEIAGRTGLTAARVHALRAGVEILLLLFDYYGLDRFHVSHEGLRHGMMFAYLERAEQWYR